MGRATQHHRIFLSVAIREIRGSILLTSATVPKRTPPMSAVKLDCRRMQNQVSTPRPQRDAEFGVQKLVAVF